MGADAAAAAVGIAVHVSAGTDRSAGKAATRLPLFPLAGAILFPRSQLPLHIFEPRYRAMVEDAVAGMGRIGIIQPQAEDGEHPPLYRVGCIGEIVGLEELDDGRFNVVLLGSTRFRLIAEADVGTAYRQADVDVTMFNDGDPDPLGLALRANVEQEARRLGEAMGLAVDWEAVNRLDDEMLVNAIAQVAPFDIGAKQALLEEPELAGRADLLVQLMVFLRAGQGGGMGSGRLQ